MQIAEPRRGAGPGPTSEALWIFVCCKSLFNKIKINEGVQIFLLFLKIQSSFYLLPCLSFSLFFLLVISLILYVPSSSFLRAILYGWNSFQSWEHYFPTLLLSIFFTHIVADSCAQQHLLGAYSQCSGATQVFRAANTTQLALLTCIPFFFLSSCVGQNPEPYECLH